MRGWSRTEADTARTEDMLGSSESRRRKKDKDKELERDRTSPKDKDREREEKKERYKAKRSSRKPSSATSDQGDKEERREKRRERPEKERTRTPSKVLPSALDRMAVVPEMERRGSLGSPNASKTSLPYPTYSKTHSKENIYSKEEGPERERSPFTPEATDLGDGPQNKDRVGGRSGSMPEPTMAPPSPPLTATTGGDLRKAASANSMRRQRADAVHEETKAGRRSVDSNRSGTRLTPEPRFAASRSSVRMEDKLDTEGTDLTSTTGSQPSTVRQKSSNPTLAVPKVRSGSPSKSRPPGKEGTPTGTKTTARTPSEFTRSTVSAATSVPGAWPQHDHSPTNSESSPASVEDSSPRTPTQASVLPPILSVQKDRPPTVEVFTDSDSRAQSVDPEFSSNPLTPPPPPPPPALLDPPRVDYLLQNGGLSRPVPRSILAALDGTPAAAYNTYMSPRVNGPQAHDVNLFAPLQRVLNDYSTVMDRNGSLAVATGYRSIARRLLERVEAVFARSIEHVICDCYMCFGKPVQVWHDRPYMEVRAEEQGVNWGEILELVSGRRELPSWPPINRATIEGLGITESSLEPPCQNIDVDVPEQYREHYARQSQKTKVAVQSWLSNQQDAAPDEADDDTLNFAMLTRLDPSQRSIYHALLNGQKKHANGRVSGPPPDSGTPPTIAKAALAIQRLYRLYAPPRNQLVVMYMIANPDIHTHLATLAAVTKHEWEILTSGRFDGFLWSGAENPQNVMSPPPGGISRGPSRGPSGTHDPASSGTTMFTPGTTTTAGATSTAPFPVPRTPHNTYMSSRPGSTRPGSTYPGGPQPVQLDEDTEIAVIAEIEREIYLSMEALEDQFELVHQRAEATRARLRERGAALAMFAQARRGGALGGGVEVRMDTPASGVGLAFGRDLDEALVELQSEIGPDDSASNVSHNRRRRGHRARERRTPAPVEEEGEEESEVGGLVERLRRRL